jgi:hypothetical protein
MHIFQQTLFNVVLQEKSWRSSLAETLRLSLENERFIHLISFETFCTGRIVKSLKIVF